MAMHSWQADRDSLFIMLIPMWSSLPQSFPATIYVSKLWVVFEIGHYRWCICAWPIAISLVTVKSLVLSMFHTFTGHYTVSFLATERRKRLGTHGSLMATTQNLSIQWKWPQITPYHNIFTVGRFNLLLCNRTSSMLSSFADKGRGVRHTNNKGWTYGQCQTMGTCISECVVWGITLQLAPYHAELLSSSKWWVLV